MFSQTVNGTAEGRGKRDLGAKWEESYPILISKARHLTAGGTQDPEDLVSQATLKVLNYLDLDRDIENFIGLMLVCLLQVYIDSKRRSVNRISAISNELVEDGRHCDFSCALPSAERSYIAKETLGDILDCIAMMPRSQQELFQMRFVSDLSYAEISRRLDISEACARQRVKKLRKKFQSWIDD